MLGEKIGEISGKVTMQRALRNLGGDPKMETSFQATGSVLGTNIKDTGTYTTIFRPDGTQYGEGQGIMITKDGKTATWTGHGVGTMHKDGTATYRGALYFQTMPKQWSRLGSAIRVRRGRRRQYTFRLLGMEVVPAPTQHSGLLIL